MSTEPRLVEVELEEPPQVVPTTAETRRTLIRLLAPPRLKLRVVLRDFLDEPVADTPVAVDLDGEPLELKTDAEGKLELDVTRESQVATLTWEDGCVELFLGRLPPLEDEAGQHDRLVNLGYLEDPDDEETVALAVEEFRLDEGLPPGTELDEPTRAKLGEVHGC